jgi:hypothetical protein
VEANKVKRATKRELIVVATMISRMIGTSVFSDRTEFSVPTNFIGIIARERNTPSQKWDGFSQKRTKWARKDRSRKWRKYL